jgi:thioredoxin:protein disulfide reductase
MRRSCIALFCAVLAASAAADGGLWKHNPSSDGLLDAAQAFQLVSAERGKDGITVTWEIAPGYYLYRKRLGFESLAPAGETLRAELPAGERVHDEFQGDAEIYHDSLQAVLHWPPQAAPPRKLKVHYQGCAEAGVCYPPQIQAIDVVDAVNQS